MPFSTGRNALDHASRASFRFSPAISRLAVGE
jgi:hypothetical protein